MSLHRLLTRLIWLCVLPLVALAAYLAVAHVSRLQTERDLEAGNLVQSLAREMDGDLAARMGGLNMLALSPLADDASRPEAMYREAQGFRQSFGSEVLLIGPAHQVLFHTGAPFGSAVSVQPPEAQAAAQAALEAGRPAVGNGFASPAPQGRLVAIAVPVLRDGRARLALLTAVEARHFQRRIDERAVPPGWSLALLDGQGQTIARRQDPERTATPADPDRRFTARSAVSPWSVTLDIPRAIYLTPMVEAAAALAIAILLATVAGVLGGTRASRRLARSVASLAGPAAPGAPGPEITEIAAVRRRLDDAVEQREQADAARLKSEQRFRIIVEQAAVGISLVDPDGRFLLVNQHLCDIAGYAMAELLQMRFQDMTHPDDLDVEMPFVRQVLAGEIASFSLEKRYVRKDGSIVWINLTAALARRPDGRPDHFISVIEDIQRRKAAETELRAKEMTLREAQRLARVGDWSADLRTGQGAWSSETYHIFGRATHLPPLTYPAFAASFTPASWHQLSSAIQACRTQGTPYACDAEIVRDDGSRRWVTVRGEATLDADGRVARVHGTLQDITERMLDKEQLRVSDLALKAISQGVLIAGPDGCILSANAAFTSITGFSEAEVLGQTCHFVQGALTNPDTVASIRRARDTLTGFTGEILNYRKDGSTFWNELTISPICTAQGALTHFIGIIRDVTARKLAADEREHNRNSLEHRVRSRTAELLDALQESTATRQRLQVEIYEHQRTEARLQQVQVTLDQATRMAGLGAWSIALRNPAHFGSNPVTWSAEMYRLLDYSPEDLPLPTPDHFFARVHPEDRKRLMATALQALAAGGSWQTEYRVVRSDGSERLVAESGEISLDRTGKPASMDGAVQDITEQRRIETQLRDSEARLHIALEGAGAGSCEWNLETGIDVWSDELWTLFGLERNAARPSYATWRQTVHPDDLAPVERIVKAALTRGTAFEIEWRVKLPASAAPRWLMARSSPMPAKDGQIVRYHGIAIDITQRKLAERALEQTRQELEDRVAERTADLCAAEAEQRRLNSVLRLLSDGNFALAQATNERQLLDDLCRLVVDSSGYLMGWVGVAEQDAAKSIRAVAQSGREEGYLDSIQLSWDGTQPIGRGPTGTAIRTGATQVARHCRTNPQMAPWREAILRRGYQSIAALPLVSGHQILGALTLFSAEPDAFGAEELQLLEELASNMAFGLQSLRARKELESYRLQLEHKVAERTREIATLNRELVDKAHEADAANRAKSAFLATMSHEIRTPLNAVVGLTGLLADSPLDRRQRSYMEKIELSAQALRALVDDVLDFSRIETGALVLEQLPVSLKSILRNTASVVGVSVRGKPIEVLFDVARDVPDALVGDALRLQQILLNLTSNAVKFTEAGDIVIAVRCTARDAEKATLQIAVRDTGIGIAAGQQRQIFELFTQAETSTSRIYGGSGLGLAISARLASLMDGRIDVESAPGAGSEFRLQVTLALGPVAPPRATEDALPGLRILIVDDHPVARDILRQTCAVFDWQATTCASGAEGLAELRCSAAEGREYDLLLLDWRMPGMDGIEMLRQAIATPGLGLPLVVLMVSIFEMEEAVAASDAFDLDGLAVKPMTPDSLHEAVVRAHAGEFVGTLPVTGKTDRRLAGMRLLVAEDNPLNQEVLGQSLTQAGAAVVIAANGLEAVEAVRAPGAHFDAVLMDIQMPVMDGYTAANIIRSEPGQSHVPIIAVTAYAQPEDREKSRRAGMAGHIVKPLAIDDLLDILVEGRRETAGRAAAQPRPAPEAAVPAMHLPGLDVSAALQAFGRDGKRFGTLLRQFVDHHGGDAQAACRLSGAGDTQGARRLVHDLRGMAGILQATELARVAAATETALREARTQAMPPLFDALQEAMTVLAGSAAQFEALWTRSENAPGTDQRP